ncbi:Wall-associated kinase family protein [Rhynchospora pubera]|uniref:Wall-associated kinase family protein n=1 Tax=Rhynchospora pubera TaxID=906938 RepID=A0AAV8E2A5_9POAL|nr:Wall-associated kinase family protein [Rhynchospora pubera]
MLVVMGSNALGYMMLEGAFSSLYQSGCMASSLRLSEHSLDNSSCKGMGCCQASISFPSNHFLILIEYSGSGDYLGYLHDNSTFNICRYAMLVEVKRFKFSTTYLTTPGTFENDAVNLPVVVDFTISNETCEYARQRMASYACVSIHSTCNNHNNGLGYSCKCFSGYQGNPYIHHGCQDIDECLDSSKCYGICTNTPGSFKCECPPDTHGNGSIPGDCYKNETKIHLSKTVIGSYHYAKFWLL